MLWLEIGNYYTGLKINLYMLYIYSDLKKKNSMGVPVELLEELEGRCLALTLAEAAHNITNF